MKLSRTQKAVSLVALTGAAAALALVGSAAHATGPATQQVRSPHPVAVAPTTEYNLPLQPGYSQSEPVSKLTYNMCQTVIDGTRLQILNAPKDQQAELLAVEAWCNALAIRTNPHKG